MKIGPPFLDKARGKPAVFNWNPRNGGIIPRRGKSDNSQIYSLSFTISTISHFFMDREEIRWLTSI